MHSSKEIKKGRKRIRYLEKIHVLPPMPHFPDPYADTRVNQIVAAEKVLECYTAGHKFVMLVSQCQSGKTGVGKNTLRLWLNSRPNGIAILIIPISSNDILAQAKREFHGIVHPDNILSLPQMLNTECIKDRMEKNPGREFILVIDESHLNATIELQSFSANCLFNSLKYAGIHPNGTEIADNCWLLSISATPNAELAGLLHQESPGKAIVYLEPGEGYYGIEDMLLSGHVYQGFDLKEDLPNFADTCKTRYGHLAKYGLIRMKSHAHCEEFGGLLVRLGIKYIIYDSYMTLPGTIMGQVQIEPAEFTILLLVHRLRASIQVDTQHICMVHENPKTFVDTIIQGLPGRMCGYNKKDHGVDIYCNPLALTAQVEWLKNTFRREYIPACRTVRSHEPIEKSIYRALGPNKIT